jgi:hypothetical protein
MNICSGRRHRLAGMQHETLGRIGARDEGRGFEVQIDALRAVLEIPAAALVALVVAVDEADQGGVREFVAGGASARWAVSSRMRQTPRASSASQP